MSARQAAVERTRESIVTAAFDLHASIGTSRTKISAIAARAGLQRHTVYAHFPVLDLLYEACTTHGIHVMGMPEPEDWRSIDSPSSRLDRGVRAMIAWHHGNGEALARLLFDVDPGAPPASTPDPFEVRMRDLKAALIEGLPVDEARRPASTMSRSRGSSSGSWRGSRRARSRPMP